MRATVALALACLSLVGITHADDGLAAIRRPVDIAPQELAPALKMLARDRDVQLVYRSDLVKDQYTGGAAGDLTFEEALKQLLRGTGLTFEYLDRNAITIVPLSLQSSPPVPEAGTAPRSSGQPEPRAANDVSRGILEEVVVTAEKRVQNIQTVPTSVSAVQGAKLLDLGMSRLADYSQYVPGLNIQDGGSPGQTSVTLRGIGVLGSGSLVSYYIDDAPLGSSSNYAVAALFALDLMPYDLDRLEVLRGPQGTLYGGGAMGGLIKYVLKPANTNTYSAEAGGEVSHTQEGGGAGYAVRAAGNMPLIQDQLGIRVSLYDRRYQGFTDDVFVRDPDSNTAREYGGRAAASWNPLDGLRINLSGLWNRTQSDDDAIVTLGNVSTYEDQGARFFRGQPVFGRLSGSHPFEQPFSKKLDYYEGTINYDAPLGITVTAASSWSRTATVRVQDTTSSYGEFPLALGEAAGGYSNYLLDLNLRKFTQELRAASATGGRLEWLIGGFYTDEKNSNYQLASVYDSSYQPINNPVFTPFFFYGKLPSTYKEHAAFGDLTLNVTSQFDVTGGVRYAHNSQEFRQITDGFVLGGFTDQPGHSSEGVTTWSGSSRYRFTREVMLYAKVATGYRPGGPNLAIAGAKPTVDSDTLMSYEAGLKSTFLDGRVLFNITGYYIDWKGIQLQVVNAACSCSYLANAGNAYSRGLELEGDWRPTRGLRLGYNAAYNKGRLTSLLDGAPPFRLGPQLPGVPVWSAGLNADYSWSLTQRLKANVGAGIRYVGEENVGAVSADPASPNAKQPAYTVGDARMGLWFERYKLNFFIRNLTNRIVYLSQAPQQSALTGLIGSVDAVPLQPRVFGASVDVEF
ncbi:MAG: TonB-dependent receptor [Proteobacteria bacterium]|nr:TonB-dependent receptor [Pseudomonadota bacterium]